MATTVDLPRLVRSLEWGLRNDLPSAELVRMLRPLVKATSATTANGCRARLQLAEHLLADAPDTAAAWEACLLARTVLEASAEFDQRRRAHGALGLAFTLLGQLRAARGAYLDALAMDPTDPVCAHNLGHLEATQFGSLHNALRWLRVAHLQLPDEPEIAASLARVQVQLGDPARARRTLERVLGDAERSAAWVSEWARQDSGDL